MWLFPQFLSAQNLVPNPSFEEYESCPYSTADFTGFVSNWVSWQETPDYFNVCNNLTTGWVGVPQNVWGNQLPITGDGYSALYTFALDVDPNAREYIAAQLISPLEVGQTYHVFFYASQIEGETGSVPMEYRCATNHIGLNFFKNPVYNNSDNPLTPTNTAHLDYSQVLSDSDNWIKIEGSLTADDEYNWVAIGNFFEDSQTEIAIQNDSSRCFGVYYIENICVATDPADCDYLLQTKEVELLNEINMYPNPSGSIIHFRSDKVRLTSISAYNNVGQLVHGELVNVKSSNIDISDWAQGLFLIVVVDENNSIQVFKLIKQ